MSDVLFLACLSTWLIGIVPAGFLLHWRMYFDGGEATLAGVMWPVTLVALIIMWPIAWFMCSPWTRSYRSLTPMEREEWTQRGRLYDNRAYEAVYPEMPLRTTQEAR